MTSSPDPRRAELLVLARLHTAAKKPPGRAELRATLSQIAGRALDPRDVRELLDGALDRLGAAGAITSSPLRLTELGRARLRDELGLSSPLPWRQMKAQVLTAVGLGLPLSDRKAKQIGRADQLRRFVAAVASGAAGTDVEAVRTALARRWLFSEPPLVSAFTPPVGAPRPSLTPAASADPGEGLAAFAAAVLRHAEAVDGEGRFGDRKVFIASLWERARVDSKLADLDVEGFKRKLVDAHRAGLLTLQRADLVPAMDQAKVSASETRYLNASFHFVETVTGVAHDLRRSSAPRR